MNFTKLYTWQVGHAVGMIAVVAVALFAFAMPAFATTCYEECAPQVVQPIYVIAQKVVCTDELDVPNQADWATLGTIDSDTASEWVGTHPNCEIVDGWSFEWALDSNTLVNPGDDLVGNAGNPWTPFGPTVSGTAQLELNEGNLNGKTKIWIREVLKANYIPFTYETNDKTNVDEVSAGLYCNNDVKNFDNYEWISGLNFGSQASYYYCVAWNVPTKGTVTVTKEVINDDKTADAEVSDFALKVGDESVTSGVSEEFAPGTYTVTESGEAMEGYTATFSGDCADGSLTVVVGESYECTITNDDKKPDVVENSCLEPSALNYDGEFEVGEDTPEGEKKLQTILDDAAYTLDVNDDETGYQVWNFSADSVTFNVEILAKYAGNTQEFGYYKAGDTTSFVSVFTIPPTLVGASFPVTVPATFANSIGFAIKTTGDQPNAWYSEYDLNTDDKDNVAVYNPSANTYVVAFEDLKSGDNDYNDLVVTVTRVECTTEEVEECSAEDNLIQNGSFEEPGVDSTNLWDKFLSVTGWAITKVSDALATTLELHRGWEGNVAADGEQYAELDGDQPVQVAQGVTTEAGATYKLYWAFAPRQDTADVENNLGVLVEGNQVATEGPMAGIGELDTEDWIRSSKEFVAADTSTDIAFKDLGPESEQGADVGTFLDDVRLCKVKDAPNDGNDEPVNEDGGNGGPLIKSSRSSGSNNNPEGEVEGASDTREQIAIVPMVAGVNAGAGGASQTPAQTLPLIALVAMIASLAVIRKTSDVR